jgi:hypothetical protein
MAKLKMLKEPKKPKLGKKPAKTASLFLQRKLGEKNRPIKRSNTKHN